MLWLLGDTTQFNPKKPTVVNGTGRKRPPAIPTGSSLRGASLSRQRLVGADIAAAGPCTREPPSRLRAQAACAHQPHPTKWLLRRLLLFDKATAAGNDLDIQRHSTQLVARAGRPPPRAARQRELKPKGVTQKDTQQMAATFSIIAGTPGFGPRLRACLGELGGEVQHTIMYQDNTIEFQVAIPDDRTGEFAAWVRTAGEVRLKLTST